MDRVDILPGQRRLPCSLIKVAGGDARFRALVRDGRRFQAVNNPAFMSAFGDDPLGERLGQPVRETLEDVLSSREPAAARSGSLAGQVLLFPDATPITEGRVREERPKSAFDPSTELYRRAWRLGDSCRGFEDVPRRVGFDPCP